MAAITVRQHWMNDVAEWAGKPKPFPDDDDAAESAIFMTHVIATPWRIDEDNAKRIVVKDDRGDIVHEAEYGDIPAERGSAFVERIIGAERANSYAMVEAVNAKYHQHPKTPPTG